MRPGCIEGPSDRGNRALPPKHLTILAVVVRDVPAIEGFPVATGLPKKLARASPRRRSRQEIPRLRRIRIVAGAVRSPSLVCGPQPCDPPFFLSATHEMARDSWPP